MTNFTGTGFVLSGQSSCGVAEPAPVTSSPIALALSGIALNQNAPPTVDSFTTVDDSFIFQTFYLPSDYPRGTSLAEIRIPRLCGLQVNVGVLSGYAAVAGLTWRIDYHDPSAGWVGVATGEDVGAPTEGDSLWFDIHFDPVPITDVWYRKFRLGVKGRVNDSGKALNQPVEYDGTFVIIEGEAIRVVPDISPSPLQPGKVYLFENRDGLRSLLTVEPGSGDVFYSVQQGVNKLWYSDPNPLINDVRAYESDGVNQLDDKDVSIRFRILADAPDANIDCLGNQVRSVVVENEVENVESTTDDLEHTFWLSKPNPSRFAVECLYFDLTDGGEPVVIDQLLMDPATTGVYFHVYYSNDPIGGTDPDSWDKLLWTRIDQTFIMRRRENFTFPSPITAKFVKIEFTRLQPRYYAPGGFQLPIRYRKHPKWVLDYFLAVYQDLRAKDQEFARHVNVTYDALDLAYNYFLDDLRQENPNAPDFVDQAQGVSLLSQFSSEQSINDSNTVDPTTLSQIRTSFVPFLSNPFNQGRFGSILRDYAVPNASNNANYSTEVTTSPVADTTTVSSLHRDSVAVEKGFPIMSFYLDCRHGYREVLGRFEQDRGYFVGVKEIAFMREHYAVKTDSPLYIESAGDNTNTERNDFETVDQTWVPYDDAS